VGHLSKAKVSVIVPVYNTKAFLRACVTSLLRQTHELIQVVLVDDGSNDGSSQLCDELAREDARIQVVHKPNGGLSDARNAGLFAATGDFICFIDSDDWAEPRMLESMLKYMDDEQLDVVMAGMIVDQEDEEGKVISSTRQVPAQLLLARGSLADGSVDDAFINLLGYAWNKLYRSDFLKTNHLTFTKGLQLVEDIDFNARVFTQAEKVVVLSDAFVHYMQRPSPSLGSVHLSNFLSLRQRAIEDSQQVLLHLGLSQTEVERLAATMGLHAMRNATSRIVRQKDAGPRQLRQLMLDARTDGVYLKDFMERLDLTSWQRVYLWGFFRSPAWLWIRAWKLSQRVRARFPAWRKRSLRFRIKLQYFKTSSNAASVNTSSTQPRVFIFLAADYGNLGDLAITEAQRLFLETELPDYEILEVPISQTLSGIRAIKKRVKSDDLITLIGGGNTGDLYDDIEYLRELVIGAFPSNRVISFPQTIEFSDTTYGRWAQKRAQRVFKRHERLTLMARDSRSASLATTLFDSTPVFAAPDIVLSLRHQADQTQGRQGFLVAMRGDLERNPSTPTRQAIHDELAKLGPVKMVDTHLGDVRVSQSQRQAALDKIWSSFAESEVVVTDRLHGMIFSVITGTPCVVLDSRTGKVSQFLNDWLSGSDGSCVTAGIDRYPIIEWHPATGTGLIECVEALRTNSFHYTPDSATTHIRRAFYKGLEF
jgi:pyruvyl transferase EpsI